ncbi:MAG: hypothetical protein JWN25_3583 [Verrucomicrobiales bacterium]|nr:hypothetical protein [Verrucomicrobiales bacterium]
MVRELINAGANVNSADEPRIGNTPLADAVDAGALEIVKMLLAAGARPEIKGWMQLSSIDRAGDNAATCANENASEIFALIETFQKNK